MKINLIKNVYFYLKKKRGNIKWGVSHPNKDRAKSSKDRYNNIEDGNGAKDQYNNNMEYSAGTKNGCDINRRVGNEIKDWYNKDIENGASKCNKYRINYNINKYHIIVILKNNYIYFIKDKSHISNIN